MAVDPLTRWRSAKDLHVVELHGVIPVLATPFSGPDDQVDYESLLREVDYLAGVGASTVAVGFGSEITRLTEREADELIEAIANYEKTTAKIVAHVAAVSIAAAVERIRVVTAHGASAVLMPPPFPASISDEDVLDYFRQTAARIDVPIVVQDAPAMTGVQLSARVLARLLSIDGIAAIKVEAPSSPSKIESIRRELNGREATILGGSGGIDFYEELARGADGTMPGPAFVELFVLVYKHFIEERHPEARQVFERLLPSLVVSNRTGDGFLYVQKEVLRRRGIIGTATLRAPADAPTKSSISELDRLLVDLEQPPVESGRTTLSAAPLPG